MPLLKLERIIFVIYKSVGLVIKTWTLVPSQTHNQYTSSVSYQKLRFTKYVGLRSIFAFLARNYVRCIALTKHFPVS